MDCSGLQQLGMSGQQAEAAAGSPTPLTATQPAAVTLEHLTLLHSQITRAVIVRTQTGQRNGRTSRWSQKWRLRPRSARRGRPPAAASARPLRGDAVRCMAILISPVKPTEPIDLPIEISAALRAGTRRPVSLHTGKRSSEALGARPPAQPGWMGRLGPTRSVLRQKMHSGEGWSPSRPPIAKRKLRYSWARAQH
jgi:hypothetical protein